MAIALWKQELEIYYRHQNPIYGSRDKKQKEWKRMTDFLTIPHDERWRQQSTRLLILKMKMEREYGSAQSPDTLWNSQEPCSSIGRGSRPPGHGQTSIRAIGRAGPKSVHGSFNVEHGLWPRYERDCKFGRLGRKSEIVIGWEGR